MDEKEERKFYQRWWFWLIVALVLIMFFTNENDEDPAVIDESGTETTEQAGEDVLEDDLIEEENNVDDEPEDDVEETPDQTAGTDNQITAGTYIVGDDIPAGEYLVFSDGMTYFESATDSTGELDSIIFNANLINGAHAYVTVNDGEYFKLQNGEMYPVEQAPSVQPDDGIYRDGMYKAGQDIDPGEYHVTLNEDAPMDMGYLQVSSDSSHNFDSIITNENVQSDTYITVSEGQYLTISNLTIERN